MSVNETVEVTGHLMDSGILSRILDDIREYGGDYVIDQIDVGHEATDASTATIDVTADDDESLQRLLMRLQTRGVNQVDPGEASMAQRRAGRGLPRRLLLDHQPRHQGAARRPAGSTWRTRRWTAASSSRSSTARPPHPTLPMSDVTPARGW